MEKVHHLRAIVEGRVQGVGFRYFVHHAAKRLHIVGLAKNQADGSVLVEAETADRVMLDAFLHELHVGPEPAQVTKVASEITETTAHYTSFHVDE